MKTNTEKATFKLMHPLMVCEYYDKLKGLNYYAFDGFTNHVVSPCQKSKVEYYVNAVNSHDMLLEACKMAYEVLSKRDHEDSDIILDILDEAINKANGKGE